MRLAIVEAGAVLERVLLMLDQPVVRYSRSNPKPIPYETFHEWGLRFLESFEMNGEDDCWNWKGTISNGYGTFTIGRTPYNAHRISFEVYKGDIPFGMEPDHTCRNRRCVNPNHLEAVTFAENARRGFPFRKAPLRGPRPFCRKGHAMTGDNLAPNGVNVICKTCARARRKAAYQRGKAA